MAMGGELPSVSAPSLMGEYAHFSILVAKICPLSAQAAGDTVSCRHYDRLSDVAICLYPRVTPRCRARLISMPPDGARAATYAA